MTFFFVNEFIYMSFGRILMHYINIYEIAFVHGVHDGLSCALPMIIVRYMYTVYHYFLFSFDLSTFIIE